MALSKIGTNQLDSTATPTFAELDVDNVKVNGNTISSTDTNGDITLDPDGTGDVVVKTAASGGTPQSDAGLVLEGTDASRCDLQILGDDGAFQSIYFGDASDADIGSIAYSHSSNSMRFTVNAAERLRVDSSGFVGIGQSTPRKTLHITKNNSDGLIILDADGVTTDHQICFAKDYGSGGTSGGNYWGIGVDGSENKLVFAYDPNAQASLSADLKVAITSSGYLESPPTYSNTTAAAANVHIEASAGQFYRSTSSRRYKNTITDATHGLTELLALRPVTYKGNNDGDTVYGGLIAEEVHDAGLTEFIQYNDDNEPDALAYGNMISLCIKAIQELKTELDEAKARIAALEAG